MPVIDSHVHVGRKEHLTPWFISYYEKTLGKTSLERLNKLTPQALEDFLDQEGVDRAVVLSEYAPKVTGRIPAEFTAEFCQGRERLIPFGSIDLDSAMDPGLQTERCVKELGCRGLKLLPSYAHFFPDDPRLFPAYEAARDLGIPIMFHTGTSVFPGSRVLYADPLFLDEVADEFPSLTIIMCHGGRPFWYKQAQWMLRRHRNLHIDISGIPPMKLPEVFPKLEQFSDRYVFGSDWPNIVSIGRQVEQVRRLPFSPDTIEAILWNNAARLFGLDSVRG